MCCSPEARTRKQARRQARRAAFAHLVQGFIGSNSKQEQQKPLPPQQMAHGPQQYPQYPQYGTMRGVTEAPPQYGMAGPIENAPMAPGMDVMSNATPSRLPTYGQVMGDEKVDAKEK